MEMPLWNARLSFKVLVTFFLLLTGVGYLFGLVNILNNTGFSFTGMVVHYRGDMETMTLPPEFAFARLIHEHHVHLFSLSMLFFLVGWIFVYTSLPEMAKAFLVAMPFLALFLDFASFWLLVFAAPFFAWFSIVFGGLMAFSFFMLIGRPLYEMWILPVWHKKWGERVPRFLR